MWRAQAADARLLLSKSSRCHPGEHWRPPDQPYLLPRAELTTFRAPVRPQSLLPPDPSLETRRGGVCLRLVVLLLLLHPRGVAVLLLRCDRAMRPAAQLPDVDHSLAAVERRRRGGESDAAAVAVWCVPRHALSVSVGGVC